MMLTGVGSAPGSHRELSCKIVIPLQKRSHCKVTRESKTRLQQQLRWYGTRFLSKASLRYLVTRAKLVFGIQLLRPRNGAFRVVSAPLHIIRLSAGVYSVLQDLATATAAVLLPDE